MQFCLKPGQLTELAKILDFRQLYICVEFFGVFDWKEYRVEFTDSSQVVWGYRGKGDPRRF